MIDSRTSPRYFSRGFLALAVVCASAGSVSADPDPRDYPPTYSSRKGPWYDPNHWFTTKETGSISTTTVETKPVASQSIHQPSTTPTGLPAWKWYGYGAPTPGNNPLAPNGTYASVPGTWYPAVGATPGAIPATGTPGVIVDAGPPVPPPTRNDKPLVIIPPVDGPAIPHSSIPAAIGPSPSVEWKSSSASIRTPESPSVDGPRATLKAPVKSEELSIPAPTARGPTPPEPRTPLDSVSPNQNIDSPDLPVVPAPGIVSPPHSLAPKRETYRARAPEAVLPDEVTAAITRACGPEVRVVEIAPSGAKQIVLRLAGSLEAAKAARERLAGERSLAGWMIEFERVTLLRK